MKHFQDLSYCICSSQVWLILRKKSGKIQRELKNITKKQPSNIYRSIIIANHLLIWLFSQALLWLSFCRKCCGWRELFCEPFQACHLQGPGSHHRSCCCATSFSKKFIHNHNTSSSTNLHVAAAFHKVFLQKLSRPPPCLSTCSPIWPPPPNVGSSVVLILSPLVIQLVPLWSSPSECKSMFKEVILHE